MALEKVHFVTNDGNDVPAIVVGESDTGLDLIVFFTDSTVLMSDVKERKDKDRDRVVYWRDEPKAKAKPAAKA